MKALLVLIITLSPPFSDVAEPDVIERSTLAFETRAACDETLAATESLYAGGSLNRQTVRFSFHQFPVRPRAISTKGSMCFDWNGGLVPDAERQWWAQ